MENIAGFFSIGLLVLIQIAYFAFSFGRLSQKVQDVCRRLNDIEHRQNTLEGKVRK